MQPVTNDRVNSCGHHGAESKSSCHVADELDSLSDSDLDVMEFSDDNKFREHRSDQSESGHTLHLVLPANDDSARDECDGDDNSNNEHEQNSNTDDSIKFS